LAALPILERGRRAFFQSEWRTAFEHLSEADLTSALEPDDLQRVGDAAHLLGRDDEAIAFWTRAHNAYGERGDRPRAARVGFWLSMALMLRGQGAQSSGWLARVQRLMGEQPPCAEHGLVLVMDGLFSMFKGDAQQACSNFERAAAIAQQFGDRELLAFGVLGRGQALIQMQRTDEGVVLLDEAMVEVVSGQVSPIVAGIIYCAVILTCERVYDLQRAHEWTVALDDWCAAQPELVAFRGQCLVHRSKVLQLKGDWLTALDEAKRAEQLLCGRSDRLAGRALYQQAELHRLAGDFARADELYRQADAKGFEPQPGVSLLRIAQGDLAAATASIRRVENEGGNRQGPNAGVQRIDVLGPFVEIMLAIDDLEPARRAANELSSLATARSSPFLTATAAQMMGAVLLASGDPEQALTFLRESWTTWQQLEVHYEAARARVLIARACERVGDIDGAKMHIDAAALVFERLGARPDLARLRPSGPSARGGVSDLSGRELEVLALVATGKTNRQIAIELGISEHTVARHLSNIFNKIGVTTRTAASAFAFEHGLV
jgi:DNA-binding CsgD family transcriptional regulator